MSDAESGSGDSVWRMEPLPEGFFEEFERILTRWLEHWAQLDRRQKPRKENKAA